jgi:hypothetical protein
VAAALLLPAIGACSADLGLGNVTFPKPESTSGKPDWTSFSGSKSEFNLRPVRAEDLVGADGLCAASSSAVAQAGDPVLPPGTPTVQGGIALQMTSTDSMLGVSSRWSARRCRMRRRRSRSPRPH